MAQGVADFIEVYDDALERAGCAAIVERLRGSDALRPGRVGSGVFTELKRSRDLSLHDQPAWADVEAALNQAVFTGLLAHVRRYPQVLVSPLMLQVAGADGANRRLVAEDVAAMDAAALAPALQACLRPGAINLQWYAAGLDVGRPRCDCDSAGDPLVRRHPADG